MKLDLTLNKGFQSFPIKDFDKIKHAANNGDVSSMYILGKFYLTGFEIVEILSDEKNEISNKKELKIEKDVVKGLKYLKNAAKDNHIGALDSLYMYYHYEIKDTKKTLECCKKLQDLGFADAYVYEAKIFEEGFGVIKNENKSMEIYDELVKSGYYKAYYHKSLLYSNISNENYNLDFSICSIEDFLKHEDNSYMTLVYAFSALDGIFDNNQDINTTLQEKLHKLLQYIERLIKESSYLTAKGDIYRKKSLCIAKGKLEYVKKNIYEAYKYFQLSKKYLLKDKRKLTNGCSENDIKNLPKTKEEELLEPLMNLGKDSPSLRIVDECLSLYDKQEGPYSLKRRIIESFARKKVDEVLGKTQTVLDEGTLSNLHNSLNKYLQSEILDIDEKRQEKKFPNLIVKTSNSYSDLEENYSEIAYLLLSGTERVLKNLFFDPYIDYFEKNKNIEEVAIQYQNFKTKLRVKQNSKPELFTIGTFVTIVGRGYDDRLQRVLDSNFMSWIKNTYNIADDNFIRQKLLRITDDIEFVGNSIRNPILHGVFAQKWILKYSLNKLLLSEDALLKDIVALTNQNVKTDNVENNISI